MTSLQFAKKIGNLVFNKKGYDVQLLDLKKLTSFADYFVICSADSDVQVKAIADEIEKSLRDEGIKVWHKEGYRALKWVLLDYVDVVVHIFQKNAREFYNIEKLWGDAIIKELKDPELKKTTTKKTSVKKSTTKKSGKS